MSKFTIPASDAQQPETVVEWRINIDGDGDLRLEVRNPGGEWVSILYVCAGSGVMERFQFATCGSKVAGITTDDHNRIKDISDE